MAVMLTLPQPAFAFGAGVHHESLKPKLPSLKNAEAKADRHHDNQAIPAQDGQRRR
jgi:hypothetical protein